uniref:Putative organic anion transporter n=1 Tax=Amblyomma parvum TaxID=251391 RepID=A0A023FV04_AMBPA
MMLFPRILPAGKNYKVNQQKKLPAPKSHKSQDGHEESGKHGFNLAMLKGVAKVTTTMIGLLTGGVMLHRFRPGPRIVAGYSAFVELAMMAGFVVMMFIGCESPVIAGVTPGGNITTSSLLGTCNVNCNCNTHIYEPVCASNRMISYFSPCHAGCRSVGRTSSNMTIYKDCSCVARGIQGVDDSYVTPGSADPRASSWASFWAL